MEEGISRDRYGRPLLPHPETSEVETYTRASTLSYAIENTYNLEAWKQRQIVSGLVTRPDLIAKAQAAKSDKRGLDQIVTSSLEVAGSSAGANLGTAIHSFCEEIDLGNELPVTDARTTAALQLYEITMKNLEVIAIEKFVACRTIFSAGTFDRIVKLNGQYYIADIKTGADAWKYAHSASVQMSVYSRGRAYSAEQGWGVSLPDFVNQERAIMIYLPASGEVKCELYWVDIATGWVMAMTASLVRKWWKDEVAWPLTF